MTTHSSDFSSSTEKPPVLGSDEIYKILSMTLIANPGTIDNDGSIHLVPMWFLRIENDICIPTSRHTHKYRNLLARVSFQSRHEIFSYASISIESN